MRDRKIKVFATRFCQRAHFFLITARVTLQSFRLLTKALLIPSSASFVDRLPSIASVVICVVAVVAVSPGANAVAVGTISGLVVLIVVVVNDLIVVVFMQTAGNE